MKFTNILSRDLTLVEQVDVLRLQANCKLDNGQRSQFGQFMTPASTARLMASMLVCDEQQIHLLDAGAGIGSLCSAAVEALLQRPKPPDEIYITAYEIDPILITYLNKTIQLCQEACEQQGIRFSCEIRDTDFIVDTVEQISRPLFAYNQPRYTCALLNPPYRKISTQSRTRRLLSQVGVETSNLYTGFLSLAILLLSQNAELIAITPRSFCNGPYFRPFRKLFFEQMVLRQIHLFETRHQAFRDNDVLQENIIISATKSHAQPSDVTITTSIDPEDEMLTVHELHYSQVIRPNDPQYFIHLATQIPDQRVAEQMASLPATLRDLGLTVSTGRVVDFRASDSLRAQPEDSTVPLIYPAHLVNGYVSWPGSQIKKPNAIVYNEQTKDLLVANEHYVLVKRFSSKEEERRVVAAIYDAERIECVAVGFENHLNYYHQDGRGFDLVFARGLTAFLNSTLVDLYIRQFNGHTQINATDLRNIRYPSYEQLLAMGRHIGEVIPSQSKIDQLLAEEVLLMESDTEQNPVQIKQRINEALTILREVGMPRAQQNERSALTLLALLDLKPNTPWSEASNPLCGITPMMDFFTQYYGKHYKPNTRETVRRQTVHQFLDAGMVVANPDQPDRPINSPKAVYQIEPSTLALLRTFGSKEWEQHLRTYLASVETLRQRYAQERMMQRIPVTLPSGQVIQLSPGGQNILVEQIILEFAPRFTPGGEVLYLGDTDEKFTFIDEERLSTLGVTIDSHGKLPDVIIYYSAKQWLILIEAVTSHGPINPKRRQELEYLFRSATVGIVYVTAFLTRQALKEYVPDISWETEVWVAESPAHLIHFDGERFLGPHPTQSSS